MYYVPILIPLQFITTIDLSDTFSVVYFESYSSWASMLVRIPSHVYRIPSSATRPRTFYYVHDFRATTQIIVADGILTFWEVL